MFVKHVTGSHSDFQTAVNDALLEIKTMHLDMGGGPAYILGISYVVDEYALHAFIEWDYGERLAQEEDN